jgi:hypothetical protein
LMRRKGTSFHKKIRCCFDEKKGWYFDENICVLI